MTGADGSTFVLPHGCARTTICSRASSGTRTAKHYDADLHDELIRRRKGEDSHITIECHRERRRNIDVVFKTHWRTLLDPPAAPRRGSAIDAFFILCGGCCWTHRQCPPGGPSSMSSSNSLVDAARPADSAPQGAAINVVFKTQWRTLPDPPAAPPPRGPTIDKIFKLSGGRSRTHWQCPPGGSPLTSSSNSTVDAAGTAGSAPRGPVIDVFFKTLWWTLSDPPAVPPRGTTIDVLQQLITISSIHCQRLPGGRWLTITTGRATSKKFCENFFWILAMLRTQRREIVKKISSNVIKSKVYLLSKKCRCHRY
jgi:hypothetical protein